MYGTVSNATVRISKLRVTFGEECVFNAQGFIIKYYSECVWKILWTTSISISAPKRETSILGYSFPRNALISPDFTQIFAPDQDYIFFARSVYEQYYLRLSIYFATHRIKAGQLTAGKIKQN